MPGLHTAFTLAGIPTKTFFFYAIKENINYTVENMTVTSSNATVCNPYFLWTGTEPNPIVITKDPQPITVAFNCTAQGQADITVQFAVQGPYKHIEFVWTKRNNLGREGLMIGTTSGGADVAFNGVATPEYDPVYHTSFYVSWIFETSFYFSMLPTFTPQRISAMNVRLNGS